MLSEDGEVFGLSTLTCHKTVGLIVFVFALKLAHWKPKLLFAPASDNRQLRWRGGRMEAYHNHLLAVAIIGYRFRFILQSRPELFSLAHLESSTRESVYFRTEFY